MSASRKDDPAVIRHLHDLAALERAAAAADAGRGGGVASGDAAAGARARPARGTPANPANY
jgi:hypothetical protein